MQPVGKAGRWGYFNDWENGMKSLVLVIAVCAAMNCFAAPQNQKSPEIVQEFPSPTYSRCSCTFSIAENGGMRMQPIFFSPCDQSFGLMMMGGRPTFFEPRSAPNENELVEHWKSDIHETTLSVKKTGTGEESMWFKGTLTVSRNKERQVVEVIGACGW